VLDRVRRRAWGLSGRLIASYILVTLTVVVLVEVLVLGLQVPLLVNGTQLQAQVNATAKSYAERYPGDSPQAMRARVERGEFDGVPYLRDESQDVARAYGAKTTPDVFVLDAAGVLRYRGAPDADCDDPAQSAAFLRGALDAVLDGRAPDPLETPPVGCSIKWKA